MKYELKDLGVVLISAESDNDTVNIHEYLDFELDLINNILNYYKRNKERLLKWMPTPTHNFFTQDYHHERLQKEGDIEKNKEGFRLWILREDRAIGNIACSRINYDTKSCYIGYDIDGDYEGTGIMGDCLNFVINKIFEEWPIHKINADVMPSNERSINLLTKLGFKEEGLLKEHINVNNKWEDHYRFALLKKD